MFSRPKNRQPSPLKLSQAGDKSNITDGKPSHNVKILNVIFQYNGHDFDAHQVLGIPTGASKDTVRQAYDNAMAGAHPDSKEFFEHAYRSILRSEQM
jgi:DnaJ-domain-containing protein 1